MVALQSSGIQPVLVLLVIGLSKGLVVPLCSCHFASGRPLAFLIWASMARLLALTSSTVLGLGYGIFSLHIKFCPPRESTDFTVCSTLMPSRASPQLGSTSL